MRNGIFDDLLELFHLSGHERGTIEQAVDRLNRVAHKFVLVQTRKNLKKRHHRTPPDQQVQTQTKEFVDSGALDLLLRKAMMKHIDSRDPEMQWDFNALAQAFSYLTETFTALSTEMKPGRPTKKQTKTTWTKATLLQRTMFKSNSKKGLSKSQERMVNKAIRDYRSGATVRKVEKNHNEEVWIGYAEGLHARHVAEQLLHQKRSVPYRDRATWRCYKQEWGLQRSPSGITEKVQRRYKIKGSVAALKMRLSRARHRHS